MTIQPLSERTAGSKTLDWRRIFPEVVPEIWTGC